MSGQDRLEQTFCEIRELWADRDAELEEFGARFDALKAYAAELSRRPSMEEHQKALSTIAEQEAMIRRLGEKIRDEVLVELDTSDEWTFDPDTKPMLFAILRKIFRDVLR